ncbi:MAG: hypothetical protein K5829_15895 [Treponema sp.]|nr:hypothetical protein [Treponema sp.]
MKKSIFLIFLLTFGISLFAQDANLEELDPGRYDKEKAKTEIIIPENQHLLNQEGEEKKDASVKIEYSPFYDEVRIYYECMYVTYDRGEAMNTVLACLQDFQKDKKYYSYRYLRDDRERFFKDERGRRKAQYISYVKFSR